MTKAEMIPEISGGKGAASYFNVRPFVDFNYDPQQERQAEKPHRHRFQEIIWIKSGVGRQAIDWETIELNASTFYFIAEGQVHQFLEAKNVNGFVLQFSGEFLPRLDLDSGHNFSELIFNNIRSIPALILEEDTAAQFTSIFDLILQEFEAPKQPGKQAILSHLLQALFVKITQNLEENEARKQTANPLSDKVLREFLSHLEENFARCHEVQFYADLLGLTPRQLSDRTKVVLGKTAKQIIESRLMLEAKRTLSFTNKSVKTIGIELGYDDPSYFSKVFKRVTGSTPQKFQLL